MPVDVQTARFGGWLRKMFGAVGHVPLAVLEDVTPVVNADLFDALELLRPREERLMHRAAQSVAQAGSSGRHWLANPAGSRGLVMPTSVVITGVGSFLEVTLAPAIGGLPGIPSDTRDIDIASGNPNPPGFGVVNAEVAVPPGGRDFGRYVIPAAGQLELEFPPLVLGPGMQVRIHMEALNTVYDTCWHWRERRATDQELAPFGGA